MAVDKSSEYMNGWTAHKTNRASGENPYNEELQTFSHRRWLSGWCDRYAAIKHGHSLVLDNEYD